MYFVLDLEYMYDHEFLHFSAEIPIKSLTYRTRTHAGRNPSTTVLSASSMR